MCSDRGLCSFSNGACTCAAGYKGGNCAGRIYVSEGVDNLEPTFTLRETSLVYESALQLVEASKSSAADFNLLLATAGTVEVRSSGSAFLVALPSPAWSKVAAIRGDGQLFGLTLDVGEAGAIGSGEFGSLSVSGGGTIVAGGLMVRLSSLCAPRLGSCVSSPSPD